MMRYQVVPYRRGLEMLGWSIWDQAVSPQLNEEEVSPAMCSLDGQTPLLFRYMSAAYAWLALCEASGLNLEAGDVRTDVYDNGQGGGVVITAEGRRGTGPAIVAHPLADR
jgi:hypothetical protein